MPRVSNFRLESGREAHHPLPLALFSCFPVLVLQGSAELPPLPGSPPGALLPLHLHDFICSRVPVSKLISHFYFLSSQLYAMLQSSNLIEMASLSSQLSTHPVLRHCTQHFLWIILFHKKHSDFPILQRRNWGSKKGSHQA